MIDGLVAYNSKATYTQFAAISIIIAGDERVVWWHLRAREPTQIAGRRASSSAFGHASLIAKCDSVQLQVDLRSRGRRNQIRSSDDVHSATMCFDWFQSV